MSLSARLAAAGDPVAVVIADDEPAMRALLVALLADRPVRVFEARTGTEALALVRAVHPKLVLLDIGMPELDGLAVCTAIKADPQLADTRVVLLTGRDGMPEIHQGQLAGADLYLTKPFSVTEFSALLDVLLVR
jgi:CheY-like chemotaxis protein